MKILSLMALTWVIFTFCTCEKNLPVPHSDCQRVAIYGTDAYKNAVSDDFELDSIWLTQDSLTVRYWYGGGCGETVMKLVGTQDNASQLPHVISAKLAFTDRDHCEAYIQTEQSFDLTPFQQSDSKSVTIQLEGRAESFEYTY